MILWFVGCGVVKCGVVVVIGGNYRVRCWVGGLVWGRSSLVLWGGGGGGNGGGGVGDWDGNKYEG